MLLKKSGSVQVPAGYDGIVIGATNMFSEEEYDYISEIAGGFADLSGRTFQYIRLGA